MLISLLCVFPHKCFNSWLKWRYLIFEGRKKPSPLPLTNWSKTEQNQKHNFIIGPWQWELREQTCNIWLSFFQFGHKNFKYSQMFELLNISSFFLPILCPTPSYFSYYWQRMPVPLMCFFFLLKIIRFLHLHSFKKTSQVPFLQWGTFALGPVVAQHSSFHVSVVTFLPFLPISMYWAPTMWQVML